VTMNDQPLPDVTVTFEPVVPSGSDKKASEVGGSSMAVTDAEGRYTLKYKGTETKGAVVGPHIVRITSAAGGGPAGGASAVAAIQIGSNYNTQSSLKADVKSGENSPIDFALKGRAAK